MLRDRLSIDVQILIKIHLGKKYQGQILKNLVGGPSSQGVQKFYEGVGVVDRGPRVLSKGVKILALRLSYLELNLI